MSLWTELVSCMLTMMQYFLVRLTLYSISLTFKCPSTPVVLVRTQTLARRVLWSRVYLIYCLGVSWNWIIRILARCARNSYQVLGDRAVFFGKIFFCMKENGPKIGFFNLKKHLIVNFYWICSIMIIYIVFCVYHLFSQLHCRIFKSTISPEQIDETASFFECCNKFTRTKSWSKFIWLGIIKNGCNLWTLKLTVSQEWADGIDWFFACWYKFTQITMWSKIFNVSMVKNGCGQTGDQTLKVILSEEWTDGINWFFTHWYRFTKLKLDQNIFGCTWSKISSRDPKICCILRMNLWIELIFLYVDNDAIIFG